MKLIKLLVAVGVIILSLPLLDKVAQFFIANTHRYGCDEQFDI